LAAALLAVVSARAELVSRGQNTGTGARALALGQAFTGVADDYSALYYNAAGLTQLRSSEVGLNLSYRMRTNDASPAGGQGGRRSIETTRINAATLILTQGCGWAIGMGYYSPTAFDDPLQYFAQGREYAYEAFGNMDHYRVAFAYAPSKLVSVGLAASALSGTEQLEIRDGITARYLEEYAGFNLEPSFLIRLSDALSLGGSAVAVERLALRDTYQEQGGAPEETHYTIRHPFQTRLGIGFQAGRTQVSLDWHGTFWSTYGYAERGNAFLRNEANYPNSHVLAVGLEHHLTRKGPVLRAGVSAEYEAALADYAGFDDRSRF
jgi:long-subunit fatty acid transport protein